VAATRRHESTVQVRGPWSLDTSRQFWEGFAPTALPTGRQTARLQVPFLAEADWEPVRASVDQHDSTAVITVSGTGDLPAAAEQVQRFLSLDVDARGWPEVAGRDPVIADAQRQLPGLRPCGFTSPYEAAAWAVLSQRIRITQAARLRSELVERHGHDGAFPAPAVLRRLDLTLPGRKAEYLQAVAEAALDRRLDGPTLRGMAADDAVAAVEQIKGLGPFVAELVVLRGANAPDALPRHERRLEAEIAEQYGPDRELSEVSQAWRPFRTWAVVYLRALRERRTHEIGGGPG